MLACLHKDPACRRADADELYRRLGRCLSAKWEQDDARGWWAAHLPTLAGPPAAGVPPYGA